MATKKDTEITDTIKSVRFYLEAENRKSVRFHLPVDSEQALREVLLNDGINAYVIADNQLDRVSKFEDMIVERGEKIRINPLEGIS